GTPRDRPRTTSHAPAATTARPTSRSIDGCRRVHHNPIRLITIKRKVSSPLPEGGVPRLGARRRARRGFAARSPVSRGLWAARATGGWDAWADLAAGGPAP